jgi:23S rRNA (uracil1939-C5)-methyltransferase
MKKARHPKSPPAKQPKPPRENPSPPQLVQIEKPVYGGAFLARVDGKAIFTPLTLPGETARVRITDEKRSYTIAEAEEIVTAALERIPPSCRHFGTCGGCQYQHTGYSTQLAFKTAILRETLERGGIRAPEEIAMLSADNESHAWAYRNRIRLAFDAQGNPGYRGRRSNRIIPIAECPIAAPLLVRAALTFAEVARESLPELRPVEIALFCDADEAALLAGIYVAPNPKSNHKSRFEELIRAFAERVPALKGAELLIAGGEEESNPAHRARTIAHWGETSLTYRAAGFSYRVDHGAFFQVNRWLVDALVDGVIAGQSGNLAWDLFAGVGLFARELTESFTRVIAVESAPAAVQSLQKNLNGTSGAAVCASTLDFLRRREKSSRPDLIIVDPPRVGLGPEITSLLGSIGSPNLTYVSCDPATLARDLRPILAAGYAIQSLTLADLFPQTFHLETVVHLHRA